MSCFAPAWREVLSLLFFIITVGIDVSFTTIERLREYVELRSVILVGRVIRQIQVLIREPSHAASARSAREKAYLHQIWLVHVLERDRLLADCSRQSLKSDRPPS